MRIQLFVATKSFVLCACLIRHLVFSGPTLLLTMKSTIETPLGRCSSWLPQVPVVRGAVKRFCFGILSSQTRPLLTASTLKGTKWGALAVTKREFCQSGRVGLPISLWIEVEGFEDPGQSSPGVEMRLDEKESENKIYISFQYFKATYRYTMIGELDEPRTKFSGVEWM